MSNSESLDEAKRPQSKQWPQYLAVLTASIAGITVGTHVTWSSPALPIILSDDFPVNVSPDEASFIATIGPLGDFVGAPFAAWFAERFGRKYGILLIVLPTFTAWMILGFAGSAAEFLIGRFISGIGEGIIFIVYPMYVGEVTDPKTRGVLGGFLSVSFAMGMLAINAYAPFLSIRDSALVSSALPILLVVLFVWMPESPYYLLMKNRMDQARESLYFLRRCDVEEELQTMKQAVDRQMSERGTFKDLFFVPSNRKAMFIMVILRTMQQFSGLSALALFTQTIFIQAGANLSPVVSTVLYLLLQLVMVAFGSFLTGKFNRKPLLITSCTGTGTVLTIIGIYFYLKDMTDIDISGISWIPVVALLSFVVFFGIGLGAIPNLMLGELFSTSVKGKALFVICIYYSLLVSVTGKLFYSMNQTFGIYSSFFMFATMCYISIIFAYCFIPETKGKTLEQIQQYLKGNKDNKNGQTSE